MLRHVIATSLLLLYGFVFIDTVLKSPREVNRRPLPTSIRAVKPKPNPLAPIAPYLSISILSIGALYFLIDAFRRPFRGDRTTALAIAILGVISFGLFSLVYYAIWGRHPLHKRDEIYSTAFCDRCIASTIEDPAPDTGTHKALVGTRFMGGTDPCPTCKSIVRTFWVWFMIPIAPLGSYRMIWLDPTHYLGRRARFDTRHILGVYAIVLALAASIIGLGLYIRRHP